MPRILDACCGSKMFWFDTSRHDTVYMDNRELDTKLCDGRRLVIEPDVVADFRDMPFPDETFALVVFDPPHLKRCGPRSWQAKKYGKLDKNTWHEDLSAGFRECWRILKPCGTLIFKWSETQISIKEVLACFSQRPIFGHTTTANLRTHWMTFFKDGEP